ncbi:metallophosphoesterase family protein [Ectobacillus ponti]|uniref:DNA repair exonuclease n=1 Tax=Ectobacillus ponti TaxID=2961894 RepID=A0AA42BPA1_9BACI|nr:DNA repair exonuclease [Ectobacillus ponti]MCP8968201.1 DNA repair exonuclease [Ectobacillus ponti]
MTSLTFLHAADLHLDSPFKGLAGSVPPCLRERMKESTFQSFRRIVDLAVKQQVDFVLLAGDIYDQEAQTLAAQLFMREQLQRLSKAGIAVYMSYGNHDHMGGKRAAWSVPEHVHVFTEPVVEKKPFFRDGELLAYIYGFSYPQRAVTVDMTPQYEAAGDCFHIGMLHGSMEGETEHSLYAPFRLQSLLGKPFDYWALGHIHKRQLLHAQPPVVYPGNIQGRHRKETGEKGCYVVKLHRGHADCVFHATADVIWEEAVLSIEGMETVDGLLELCRQTMEQKRRGREGVLLRLILGGAGPMAELMADERQREDLLAALQAEEEREDFVYVTQLDNRTAPSVSPEELRQHPFFSLLLEEAGQRSAVQAAVQPLWSGAVARQLLVPFTEEEEEEIAGSAERLLLQLLAGGGGTGEA